MRWSGKAIWGRDYTASDGTTRKAMNYAGWTTSGWGTVPTDSIVKTYDGRGSLVQTLTRTDRSARYDNNATYHFRNPVNVATAPGKAKVTITVGRDNDGRSNCTMTFVQPGASQVRPGAARPVGVPGDWTPSFSDEFNGTALDTSKWVALEGYNTNGVTTRAKNVSVSGGNLVLTLESSSSGAEVDSAPYDGAGANGYLLPVGGYAEARINFPGRGSTIYNWPAWWASGPNWPAAGEHDIAEGLGNLTVNYHSPSGAHNQGTVPGTWSNSFHTYGLHRKATSADVYWDGRLVKSYRTDDNGGPQALLLNVGRGRNAAYGAASQVKVDYVRAWR
ncbi:MAG TPA: family 16 glycosylhydrolase [Propionibacteriaceae bacterium]|nr:family 16 glycosylhydrolase [Propionibacteriaceae bacterium]